MSANVEILTWAGKVLAQLVTWVLVVVGWLVVFDQNNYREVTKSVVKRIGELRVLLREIEAKAFQFHTENYDQRAAEELLRLLKRFSDELADLRAHEQVAGSVSNRSSELRRAITLKNFDQSSFAPVASDDELIGTIRGVTDATDRDLCRTASVKQMKPRPLFESIRDVFTRLIW